MGPAGGAASAPRAPPSDGLINPPLAAGLAPRGASPAAKCAARDADAAPPPRAPAVHLMSIRHVRFPSVPLPGPALAGAARAAGPPGRQAELEAALRKLEKEIAAVRGLAFKKPVVAKIVPRPKGADK